MRGDLPFRSKTCLLLNVHRISISYIYGGICRVNALPSFWYNPHITLGPGWLGVTEKMGRLTRAYIILHSRWILGTQVASWIQFLKPQLQHNMFLILLSERWNLSQWHESAGCPMPLALLYLRSVKVHNYFVFDISVLYHYHFRHDPVSKTYRFNMIC